jgi:hypothetical protein
MYNNSIWKWKSNIKFHRDTYLRLWIRSHYIKSRKSRSRNSVKFVSRLLDIRNFFQLARHIVDAIRREWNIIETFLILKISSLLFYLPKQVFCEISFNFLCGGKIYVVFLVKEKHREKEMENLCEKL